MKTTFALLTGVVTILAFATPSHAQLQAASLIDNYVVTGTESDGKTYDGLVITMDKNGALELKWDGGKYIGIGQVVGNTLAVATNAENRVVIILMEAKPDGSLEGKYWRRTDAGTKGTEVWKKK
jgi:secreted trypsin-like serine protease